MWTSAPFRSRTSLENVISVLMYSISQLLQSMKTLGAVFFSASMPGRPRRKAAARLTRVRGSDENRLSMGSSMPANVTPREGAPMSRPSGRSLDKRGDLLAALALLLLYLAFFSGHFTSIDGMTMFAQARSILDHGSLTFSEPIQWGHPIQTSRYGLGLSLLYLPSLAALRGTLPAPYQPSGDYDLGRVYRDGAYTAAGAPLHILITVITAIMIARFCRRLGLGSAAALAGMALFGIGSPAFVYARGDFAQPLLGLCWITALSAALEYRRSGSMRQVFWCSLAAGYGIITRPVEGTLGFLAVLIMFVPFRENKTWPCRKLRDMGLVVLGGAAGVGVTLVANHLRFGHWWATGYAGALWKSPWTGLAGLLISPSRGIVWAFPAVLLAPAGVRVLWKRRHRVSASVLAGLAAVLIVAMGVWTAWWGGWNWGPRLILPALPLLAVLAGAGLQGLRRGWRPWIAGLLLSAGLIWSLPGVTVDLLGGYGGQYSSARDSFRVDGYPPIGAWRFVDHLLASSPTDNTAIDIYWFRAAKATNGLSILAFAGLIAAAMFAAYRLIKLIVRSWETTPGADE